MAMFQRLMKASSMASTMRMSMMPMSMSQYALRMFSSRNVPGTIYYTKDHEYIRIDTPNTATIGISDFAQHSLGEIVFVDLPNKNTTIAKGKSFGSIESVKSANDVYMPVSGTVTDVNAELADNVQRVNEAAETEGWMIKVSFNKPEELDDHMDATAYKTYCDESAH